MGVGERGSHSHTEGAQGGPGSRSVPVPLLWGGGSPPPSYSPPPPPPSRPTPFLGQVGQSTWKQAGLQTPCLPHLPPNPQHTLVPGRMKVPAPTTKQWLRRLNRSTGSKSATVNLQLQWCPVLSCDAGTQTASVWACTLTECPYIHV